MNPTDPRPFRYATPDTRLGVRVVRTSTGRPVLDVACFGRVARVFLRPFGEWYPFAFNNPDTRVRGCGIGPVGVNVYSSR